MTDFRRIFTGAMCAAALAAIFAFTAAAQPGAKPAPAESYAQMLTRVKAGDTKIDYKAFRMAFADSGAGAANIPELSTKMYLAASDKKCADVLAAATQILDTKFVDITAHAYSSVCYKESGNMAKADFHKAIYLGLVNSILAGADGKTPKTAFVVIDSTEEDSVVTALHADKVSRVVKIIDGHNYDIVIIRDPKTTEPRTLHFNIDIQWKGYEKMFKTQ